MMTDLNLLFGGLLALIGIALAAGIALKAWNNWLELKKMELACRTGEGPADTAATGGRIELADLKARIRKLEAIASGIDI